MVTLKRMYKHNPVQMLTGRAFKLWAPMPGIATHMTSTDLAPGVDWDKLIAAYKKLNNEQGTK